MYYTKEILIKIHNDWKLSLYLLVQYVETLKSVVVQFIYGIVFLIY